MYSSESRNCLLMIKRPYVGETMQITSRASSASQTYESSWAQGSRRKVFREKQTEAAAIAWVSQVLPWFLALYVCAGKSFPESDFSATCSTAGHVESDLLVSLHHRPRQTCNASFLRTCVFFRSRQIWWRSIYIYDTHFEVSNVSSKLCALPILFSEYPGPR